MDFCSAQGYTPVYASDGVTLIACQDANGNTIDLGSLSAIDPNSSIPNVPQAPTTGVPTPSTAPQTVTPTTSTLGLITGVENDFLSGYKAITQPGLPAGQVGFSLGLGAAGGSLSGSPIVLLLIFGIAYLALRKEL